MNPGRLTAGAVLICGGALIGRVLASACVRRCQALDAQLDAWRVLGHHMLVRRLPLSAAMRACLYPPFVAAADALDAGAEPERAYADAIARHAVRGQMLDCLSGDDLAPTRLFFESIGGCGGELVRARLAETEEALKDRRRLAVRKRDEQAKLYTSLGALLGLALAILLM